MTIGIVSPLGFLTSLGYRISYPGGSVSATGYEGSLYSNGKIWNINLNIINPSLYDVVNVTYYYTTSTGANVTKTFYHTINYMNATNSAWSKQGDQYTGLGIFERIIIVILAVILVAGFGFMIAGAGGSLLLGLLVYVFFVATGFIPLWTILISLLIGLLLMLRGGIFG